MDEEDYIAHIGIKRRSGRYPWGSGGDPYQTSRNFKSYIDELRKPPNNMTYTQIAKTIEDYIKQTDPHAKFTTTDLRANIAISTEYIRGQNIATAQKLAATKMSNVAIAKEMNTRESTIRDWLKATVDSKIGALRAIANHIKEQVDEKLFLDVGKGNHLHLGVSFTRFNTAVAMLRDDGYEVHPIKIRTGPDKMTNTLVLCKPGTTWHEARDAVNRGDLKVITGQSDDNGATFTTPKSLPVMMSSKRISVRHAEDGGAEMDGVLELRRGVADLDLGGARYAQVRVAVDGTHFMKGMAMYADDLPPGVDIRYNSNKSKAEAGPEKTAVMKPLKMKDGEVDAGNPFGANTFPQVYKDKNGNEVQSALNIVGSHGRGNVEGRWNDWSKTLSSQVLSKQPTKLASAQLEKARAAREKELKEIMALTNPVVKEKLLKEFADSSDAAAVHLKAAHMPRQSTHVILPMNAVRPHEIYAPNYDNGEKVVLVRHPHGGPFEIPELTVNNKNATARRILGTDTKDAVGIHHTVAQVLSGADFDGDTVLVIPNDRGQIKRRDPLPSLGDFDAKTEYRKVPGMKVMTKHNTQTEMGKISNLITDMTIQGANDVDLAKAVRHSMVVIDAEKHELNYKQSEIDHSISALKKKYQGAATAGATTIISRAGADTRVPQIKARPAKLGGPINKETGELEFVPTGRKYTVPAKISKRTGEPLGPPVEVESKTKGPAMRFVKDARDLMSSRTNPQPMEEIYATHANSMKALANQARKEYVNLKMPTQSKQARELYAKEYESLNAKLKIAQRNAPLERRAQAIGNALAKSRIDDHPEYDKDDIKKIQDQALQEGRQITGASKVKVGSPDSPITNREWEAIQAGALSTHNLRELLSNADMTRVRELATPKYRSSLTPGQIARAKQMASSGRSMGEIAETLGLPRTTIIDNINNA